MKIAIRVLLAAACFLLLFMAYRSVSGDIEFEREATMRDNQVIRRLVDIRTAQVAFRARTGSFTADLDELANFVRSGYVASIRSYGELTEAQLEAGMTVARAMEIINTGDRQAIERAGLWDAVADRPQLVRDSIFTPVMEVHFVNRPDFNPTELPYVPFGNNARFEMAVDTLMTASGPLQVFEARTLFTTYLSDLDNRLLQQKIQRNRDRPGDDDAPRRFPGMKVGSVRVVVNNAGNWE